MIRKSADTPKVSPADAISHCAIICNISGNGGDFGMKIYGIYERNLLGREGETYSSGF